MKPRWIMYKTPTALIREWRRISANQHGVPLRNVKVDDAMLATIVKHGMWAFVDTKAKRPVVRYWHKLGQPIADLAMMLGHELGHATGKQLRGHLAEEDRADGYGRVAAEVVKRLVGR